MSYPRHSLGESYPSSEMQSAYSTALANRQLMLLSLVWFGLVLWHINQISYQSYAKFCLYIRIKYIWFDWPERLMFSFRMFWTTYIIGQRDCGVQSSDQWQNLPYRKKKLSNQVFNWGLVFCIHFQKESAQNQFTYPQK